MVDIYIKKIIMAATQAEKDRLFKQVRHQLGAPVRKVELPEEELVTLLELSIEDYAEYVQNWLIDNQWSSFLGHEIDTVDMAFALTTRSLDFETKFTYAYSKQVGLQARGPWELKKDYVEIEAGRQVYEIPAGREVNQVLWMTPPVTDRALFSHYGGFDWGFGGGYAQVGGGIGAGGGGGAVAAGRGGYYIAPAFDVLLTAADMNLKHRLLRSDLVYKITAGPGGTKLLHLISTPGSRMSFGHGGAAGGPGVGSSTLGIAGCRVWYHYYDAADNAELCRQQNPDVITMPNEVPLTRLDYDNLNEPTKILVRQILTAKAKQVLGAMIRGKFGGVVGPPEAERTMNWEFIAAEGATEYKEIFERLKGRLEQMTNTKMLERKSLEAEYVNKTMKYRPLGLYVI